VAGPGRRRDREAAELGLDRGEGRGRRPGGRRAKVRALRSARIRARAGSAGTFGPSPASARATIRRRSGDPRRFGPSRARSCRRDRCRTGRGASERDEAGPRSEGGCGRGRAAGRGSRAQRPRWSGANSRPKRNTAVRQPGKRAGRRSRSGVSTRTASAARGRGSAPGQGRPSRAAPSSARPATPGSAARHRTGGVDHRPAARGAVARARWHVDRLHADQPAVRASSAAWERRAWSLRPPRPARRPRGRPRRASRSRPRSRGRPRGRGSGSRRRSRSWGRWRFAPWNGPAASTTTSTRRRPQRLGRTDRRSRASASTGGPG
jgi:hypothetical protein